MSQGSLIVLRPRTSDGEPRSNASRITRISLVLDFLTRCRLPGTYPHDAQLDHFRLADHPSRIASRLFLLQLHIPVRHKSQRHIAEQGIGLEEEKTLPV